MGSACDAGVRSGLAMLFKKKKGAPPPVRETPSPEAQATTKQILVKYEELNREFKEIKAERNRLKRQVEEFELSQAKLRTELEAALAAGGGGADPFAASPSMEASELRAILERLDGRRSQITELLRSASDRPDDSESRARLLERLVVIDELFASDVARLQQQAQGGLSSAEVEAAIVDLESREDAKRQDLLEKLKTWKTAGIVTTHLEKGERGSLAVLDRRFSSFQGLVQRLDDLSAQVRDSDLDDDTKRLLSSQLRDPDNIGPVEQALAAADEAAAQTARRAAEVAKEAQLSQEAEAARREREELEARAAAEGAAARAAQEEADRKRAAAQEARAKEERAKRPAPTQSSLPAGRAPTPEPEPQPAPSGSAPTAAGGSDDEARATELMAQAEKAMAAADAEGRNTRTAAQMLKLAGTFQRSKKYDKVITYAEKALAMLSR